MATTLMPATEVAAPSPARLWTIDALRGVAALGVVLFHASDRPGMDRSSVFAKAADFFLNNGRFGVWLFFVISGFCIHLRWASRAARGDTSTPDFVSFWKRRFVRLYPPYFAALVIFIVLRISFGVEVTPKFVRDIIQHLLLIQNNIPGGSHAINEVFWTLAIEEQLYLLYFVFLPLRVRYGWTIALSAAMGLRIAWFAGAFLVHRAYGWEIVVTQMAFVQWIVWILGALSVEAWFGVVKLPRVLSTFWLAVVALIVAGTASHFYYYLLDDGTTRDLLWLFGDVFWAFAFFVLVNATMRFESGRPGWLGRWLAGVGLYSYSLYLTHEIITIYGWNRLVMTKFMLSLGDTPSLILIPVLTAGSLLFGRMFFAVFERPFLSASRIRRVDRA